MANIRVHGAGYAMYVWTNSYDSTVPSCTESDFLSWNTADSTCFTHSWNTESKRTWLWDTCNVQGREVTTIYLSGALAALKGAYENRNSSFEAIDLLKSTLTDGHNKVPGLRIYALFADSDIDVSEKDKVAYVVHYNDQCAGCAAARFDGVAVNNEAYGQIKCPRSGHTDSERVAYLTRLQMVKTEAQKQTSGTLLTHYSIGWHWGYSDNADYNVTWNGRTQPATRHMMDIFDSTDIQVATTDVKEIKRRLDIAGLQYARDINKEIFTTLYLNKASPNHTSFFPVAGHEALPHQTEKGLWNVVDSFHGNGIEDARPCLHYFRGAYSSGGSKDWPSHCRKLADDSDKT